MFQTAELGQKVSREDFDRVAVNLRTELLSIQNELRNADFPVIVCFAGVDGAGKSVMVNLLNEWMDPHWIVTRAYDEPSEEEGERPEYWRYWRDLPPKGMIGLFLSAWYSRPLLDRAHERITLSELDTKLERVTAFEKMLANDGALILKFWMHLSRDAQKRRLKSLEKDPLHSWRVSKTDWQHWKRYDHFVAAAEHTLRRTDTGQARWIVVEGEDSRFRALSVLTSLRDAIRSHLDARQARLKVIGEMRAAAAAAQAAERKRAESPSTLPSSQDSEMPRPLTILNRLDMSLMLPKADYGPALAQGRADLATLCRAAKAKKISTLLVFEGVDAAGKGGAIRRLTSAIEARDYQVIPVAAPTDEERSHHYLWRFWRHLPRAGRVTVFDRSWYGRVLVERVEGFAAPDEWSRAYAEINDFEEQLTQHGIVLVKFWLHVSKDEQFRRFKERETIAYKSWKLTDEDWRNRARWDQYEQAVHEMCARTSTSQTPWTLIEGNDKNYARVKILKTVCDQLREAIT